MSFLAPLYLLAGLAVAGPILFHLIRRTPRGRQVFSSVMFLQPSPPRLTKRSRIEDWLLLLLRASILVVLALAFARPFVRTVTTEPAQQEVGRRLVVLIDASASLQREGVWDEVPAQLQESLGDLQPEDIVSCTLFDSARNEILSADEWQELPAGERLTLLVARVQEFAPSWRGTQLDEALIETAEELDALDAQAHVERTILLVSDLAQGAQWEGLQGFTWPKSVGVRLVPVGQRTSPTNAAIQVVEDPGQDQIRVRVSNAAGSTESLFLLTWADEFSGPLDNSFENKTSQPVYVPAGQSRVVRAPEPSPEVRGTRLVLTGDDHPFDNVVHVTPRQQWQAELVWLSEPNDEALRFFVEPLFPETPGRTIKITDWTSAAAPTALPEQAALILCATSPTAEQWDWLQAQTRQGATLLWIAVSAKQVQQLYQLQSQAVPEVTAETADDYFMLGDVDFQHPLLRPFDDPRFSDFTKLRFWKRYRIERPAEPNAHVLWHFADGAPALLQSPFEAGQIVLLLSNWRREESELAVWSKFVPMMNGLLEAGRPPNFRRSQYTVGESILLDEVLALDQAEIWLRRGNAEPERLTRSDALQLDTPGRLTFATTQAGLSTSTQSLSVNLPPAESETAPLATDVLVAAGVNLGTGELDAAQQQLDARQLLNQELEARQQWWRMLLLAVLGLLIVESLVAARRRADMVPQAA
ncbi:MAG: BatA domain-containing protein [Planctomycetaceae bacterium]|nr:BatA domain-containing protein [Planctomycetaceae bacterium]